MKLNFTKRSLDALPSPAKGKRLVVHDAKVHGLAMRVTSTGTKTFVSIKKVNGWPELVTHGQYPDLSIEQARGLASAVNAQIAKGENSNDKRRMIRKEDTLGALFDTYLKRHAKPYKRSWCGDAEQFRLYLAPWSNRKLSAIHKRDIQALHAKIGTKIKPFS